MGPYSKSAGSKLLKKQWEWLEAELQQPEAIKIIASNFASTFRFYGVGSVE